jgi:SAM-dependent methyltransferase
MTRCLVCEGGDILRIERRERVPVAQNLIFRDRDSALRCPAGRLDIRRCAGCGFAWNAAFDPALLVYDADYDNDQNFSGRFRGHTEHVARRIADRAPRGRPLHLVEVGCGQGQFMAILAEELGPRLASALGFDPAWKGAAGALPPGCEVRGELFAAGSPRPGDSAPDVVVSRHVIEHVPDPVAFLGAIRDALPDGVPLFVETPDIDWILSNGVFFDLYYEHCSLFTRQSLAWALTRSGFEVEEVEPVFDGQYLLAVATAGTARAAPPPAPGHDDLGYAAKRDRFLASLGRLVDAAGAEGGVALWGGASKGVTLCLTLPDAARRLECVIDINRRKQGCYLPSTGIPVVAPAEAARRGVRTAIVVNPAYAAEIEASCARDGLPFRIRSIDEVEGA